MKVYKLFHLASFVHNIYLTSYLSKPYEAIRYINNNAWYIYINNMIRSNQGNINIVISSFVRSLFVRIKNKFK